MSTNNIQIVEDSFGNNFWVRKRKDTNRGIRDEVIAYAASNWICKTIPLGGQEELANKFGVSRQRIGQILSRDARWDVEKRKRKVRTCLDCIRPALSRRLWCEEHLNITLSCYECEKTFNRLRSNVFSHEKNPRYIYHQYFCSRRCLGRTFGKRSGFGNPNHPLMVKAENEKQ